MLYVAPLTPACLTVEGIHLVEFDLMLPFDHVLAAGSRPRQSSVPGAVSQSPAAAQAWMAGDALGWFRYA